MSKVFIMSLLKSTSEIKGSTKPWYLPTVIRIRHTDIESFKSYIFLVNPLATLTSKNSCEGGVGSTTKSSRLY